MATCLPEHAGRPETACPTTLTITKVANVNSVGSLSTSIMNMLCTAVYRDNKNSSVCERVCARE